MDPTTVLGRVNRTICTWEERHRGLARAVFVLLGLGGVGLLATEVIAGEPLTGQLWFVAFAIGYAVGAREFLSD
jgi:predicted membrane channel-forming protein YqfA (hemolysin III family)